MSNKLTPFPRFYGNRRIAEADSWTPRVDVHETESAYVLTAEVPGVDPADVDVTVEKNVLSIKGSKTIETPAEAAGYASRERFSGTFERRFRLPDAVESGAISAKANHGLIEITVPKAEIHQPQRIAIAS